MTGKSKYSILAGRFLIKMDHGLDIFTRSFIIAVIITSYKTKDCANLATGQMDSYRPKMINFNLVKSKKNTASLNNCHSSVFFKDNGYSGKNKTDIADVEAPHYINLVYISDDGPIGIELGKLICSYLIATIIVKKQ